MSIVGGTPTDDTPPQPVYHILTVVLAGVVLAGFGGERLLYETTGTSASWALRYVLSGTVLAVAVSAVYASFYGTSVATSILVASGPIIGLAWRHPPESRRAPAPRSRRRFRRTGVRC